MIQLNPELQNEETSAIAEKKKAEEKLKAVRQQDGSLPRTPGSIPEALIDF